MQPARLGNLDPVFRALENEVGGFEGKRLRAIAAGKQPRVWAIDAPIRPQGVLEAGRQERLTVFLSFALGNAQAHAMAVNVGDAEMHHFTRPEAGILRHLQEGRVPRGLSRCTQLAAVSAAEDAGEGPWALR